MLDAQLSIVSQWRIAESSSRFKEPELLFLNEIAIGIGHDGEVSIEDEHQPFKKRILAIPRILARRVEGRELKIDLSKQWGEHLLQGNEIRSKLVHSPIGVSIPRVPLGDLLLYARAMKSYFTELCSASPTVFQVHATLLDAYRLPTDLEFEKLLSAARESRGERYVGLIDSSI